MLGLLLRRYDLRPDPGYRLKVTERLTLMPEGLRLHLERRSVTAGVSSAEALDEDPSELRCPVHGARD